MRFESVSGGTWAVRSTVATPGQPGGPGRVEQIWVTNAANGTGTAYYDVWTTLNFGR
jgi:hypothetical protein